jgi:hypothetical protein
MTERKLSNWVLFVKKHMKGKKFGSRAEVNAYMKTLSQEFKKGK